MELLWEAPDGLIHACESGHATPDDLLIWTECEIDVPANMAFIGDDEVTCKRCLEIRSGTI